MTRFRFFAGILFAGSLLPASAHAAPQTSPAAAPSQSGSTAGAQQDARPSATAPAAPAQNTPAQASPASASARLLMANADKLVDLAQQLKTEMDKTNQYVFSLNTIRRAQDVEKLAKELQKQLQHAAK
jgi:predicted phage gp36 major capsid-like protein